MRKRKTAQTDKDPDAGHLRAVARAVRTALSPSSLPVWCRAGIRAFVEQRVAPKLRHVAPDRIRPAKPYLAGPALEALRYVEAEDALCELYANLLASSMDPATAVDVHPAFVEIIKSMTPDEAKVMQLLSSQEPHPVVDVHVHPPEGRDVIVIRNLSLIGHEAGCKDADSVSTYLDNLARLGLVEVRPGAHLIDGSLYRAVEGAHEVAKMKALVAGTKKTVSCERKTLCLTSFGRQFCLACIVGRPASSAGQTTPGATE
jgi:hypothetical protein